jgi:hypothetical protein
MNGRDVPLADISAGLTRSPRRRWRATYPALKLVLLRRRSHPQVKADQRVDQFLRLRDAIEERASRKFFERPVDAEGPMVLRSNDFSK